MTFIQTVPPEEASGLLAEHYAADREMFGGSANMTRAFSLQPEVYGAWKQLNAAIKAGMDLRRYELATLAAARRLRSSYCMLAHGQILADRFLDADAVRALASDGDGTAVDAADRAVMALAEKIVDDATAVTQADIDGLRDQGLGDSEILGVILAASVRCFFSKVLDATGAQPDSRFAGLDPALRDALTVGRPIAS
jgi:alkylhydroperoxidase family enzyme